MQQEAASLCQELTQCNTRGRAALSLGAIVARGVFPEAIEKMPTRKIFTGTLQMRIRNVAKDDNLFCSVLGESAGSCTSGCARCSDRYAVAKLGSRVGLSGHFETASRVGDWPSAM